MDRISKRFKMTVKALGYFGVFIGFVGMVVIAVTLTVNTIGIFSQPDIAKPGAQLLLPGAQIPGFPVFSFIYWLLAISSLVFVHELSHGILARLNKIRVKSSGVGVLALIIPILPIAFVEPDEREMEKSRKSSQLAVLAAGSLANFILAFLAFLIFSFTLLPAVGSMYESKGLMVASVVEGSPIAKAGIMSGEIIKEVNGNKVNSPEDFLRGLDGVVPNDKVTIKTEGRVYSLIATVNNDDPNKGYLGLFVQPNEISVTKEAAERYGIVIPSVLKWLSGLFLWVYLVNLFVGLFNLLPISIPPVATDGTRMFYLGILSVLKKDKPAKAIWFVVNILFIGMLVINFFPKILTIF